MATTAQKAARQWELHYPAALATATFALILWQGDAAYAYATSKSWKIDQLYTCVFTIATVITAFLFTFYTFIITGDRGFLGAAKSSTYFKQTIGYTFRAIGTGTVLVIATIPMLVVQPPLVVGDPWLVVAAGWAGLAVWSGASFVRAAWLFTIFAGKQ